MNSGMRHLVPLVILLVCATTALAVESFDPVTLQFSGPQGAGPVSHESPEALPQRTEHLYAVDVTTDFLLLVDKFTAQTKQLSLLWPDVLSGLAYDHEATLIYATEAQSRLLVTIDPAAGWTTTAVGNTDIDVPHAAAIDPSDGKLYVLGRYPDHGSASALYEVDKVTGAALAIGLTGFEYLAALDFDPHSGLLYAARGGPYDDGFLITISTVTGEGTVVAPTRRLTALSFDADGVLYGVDNGAYPGQSSQLYIVDKTTGASTHVGDLGVDNMLGAVFDSTVPSPVEGLSWGRIKMLFSDPSEGTRRAPLSN